MDTELLHIVHEGWLERKGKSILHPWSKRWIVLTMNKLSQYTDNKKFIHKCELDLDNSTRIVIADQLSYSNYRFCVITNNGIVELSTPYIEERDEWIEKFLIVAELKSELGSYVFRVDSEADFRYARDWETSIVAHSLDASSGFKKCVELRPENDNAFFASFLPFEQWQDEFEPEVRKAREESEKATAAAASNHNSGHNSGGSSPIPATAMGRLKDYMVDTIVTNITSLSTDKICKLLLEGMCQLIAASERQLTRRYHNDTIAAANADSKPDDVPVTTAATTLPDIPLSMQEDLICALGSLRALISSYRFASPVCEGRIQFSRRLAIHRLERSLSRVIQALERKQRIIASQVSDLEVSLQSKLLSTATTTSDNTTTDSSVNTIINDSNSINTTTTTHNNTATMITNEPKEQLRIILRSLLNREYLQLEAAPLLQSFIDSSQCSMTGLEGLAAEVTNVFGEVLQRFIEKKIVDLEEVVMKNVEVFIHIVGDVSNNSTTTSTTSSCGSSSSSHSNSTETALCVPSSSYSVTVRDTESKESNSNLSSVAVAVTAEEVAAAELLRKVAIERDDINRKINEYKESASFSIWNGNESVIIEAVLLQKANALWHQLEDTIRGGIHSGICALLEMIAGGGASSLSAGITATTTHSTATTTTSSHHQQQQQRHNSHTSSSSSSTTSTTTTTRTGYFF